MSAYRSRLPRGAARLTLVATIVAAFFSISAAHAAGAGCFAKPSACGYPDATTAGVPAGTELTTVKSVTLSAGQTLEGKNVTDGVVVAGPNVTIRNSRIATPSGGNGETAIELQNGATDFTLERSEVTGNGSKTNAPESNVWNHYDNAGFRVVDSYLHGVPDNIEGAVAEIRDSFVAVDAEYAGAHSENVYLCGASANVQHSTLYNESDETSLIFGDGICGKGNTVTVENSMLAGGGYMLQPNAKGVSAPVRIVGNRVGRCLTTASQDSGGGYVCASGADANGFWPRGGHYGLDTELGSAAVWSENVWDDNSQPMCANEKAGCGVVTPPTEPTEPAEGEPTEEGGSEEPTEGGSEPTEEEGGGSEAPTEGEPSEEGGSEEPTEPGEEEGGPEPTEGGETGEGGPGDQGGPGHGTAPAEPPAPHAPTGTEATPPPSPVPLPGTVVGAVAEVAEGTFGDRSSPTSDHAAAIWHASRARVGGPVILDGTDSKAPGHLTCIWRVKNPNGSTVTARRRGCRVRYHFHRAGIAHVTLTVRGAHGTTARSRRALVVRRRQSGQPRLARAARAF